MKPSPITTNDSEAFSACWHFLFARLKPETKVAIMRSHRAKSAKLRRAAVRLLCAAKTPLF